MKPRISAAIVAAAAGILATPTLAQHLLTRLGPDNLSSVIGDTVLGAANADVGVVSGVDTSNGTITITGRHGEVAHISSSWAGRDGLILRAPALTTGGIKMASDANLITPGTLWGAPRVIIVEPPAG